MVQRDQSGPPMTFRSLLSKPNVLRTLWLAMLLTGIWTLWVFCVSPSAGVSHHINGPLPASATLDLQHEACVGFSDVSYAFRFTVTDDKLRDQLIANWKLLRTEPSGELKSFVALAPPPWFPKDRDRIQAFEERYSRIDVEAEKYWCVWIDRKNNRLYAEYGRW